jgi:hypothetical protein
MHGPLHAAPDIRQQPTRRIPMVSSRFLTAGLCSLALAACQAERGRLTEPVLSHAAVEQTLDELDELDALSAAAAAERGNQSATGHANTSTAGALRTFSFSAIRHKDGTVTGQFQLINRFDGTAVIHGEVTCLLAIARPHQGAAFMGGVVTRVDGDAPGFFPGRPVVFSAFDNGEGANEPPDQITGMVPTSPEVRARQCTFGIRVGSGPIPIEDGNIQVRP